VTRKPPPVIYLERVTPKKTKDAATHGEKIKKEKNISIQNGKVFTRKFLQTTGNSAKDHTDRRRNGQISMVMVRQIWFALEIITSGLHLVMAQESLETKKKHKMVDFVGGLAIHCVGVM
jgi:hypothetical protein